MRWFRFSHRGVLIPVFVMASLTDALAIVSTNDDPRALYLERRAIEVRSDQARQELSAEELQRLEVYFESDRIRKLESAEVSSLGAEGDMEPVRFSSDSLRSQDGPDIGDSSGRPPPARTSGFRIKGAYVLLSGLLAAFVLILASGRRR